MKSMTQIPVYAAKGCQTNQIERKKSFTFARTSTELCETAQTYPYDIYKMLPYVLFSCQELYQLLEGTPRTCGWYFHQTVAPSACSTTPNTFPDTTRAAFEVLVLHAALSRGNAVIIVAEPYHSLLCSGSVGDKNYTIYICTIC